MSTTREPGCYHVKDQHTRQWRIAYWSKGNFWSVFGGNRHADDSYWSEIIEEDRIPFYDETEMDFSKLKEER